jgi:Cof subfamily protein (haloacid dehalogenase superfamily)
LKYKILCSDLDGTLLSTKSDVSETTITTLNKIKDNTKVILVSARMPKSMTYIQKNLGVENEPIICYNGALVLDKSKEIESVTIPLAVLKKIYQLSEEHNIQLGLYYKDEWFVEATSKRVEKEIRNTKAIPEYRPTSETFHDWKTRKVTGAHKVMMMGNKTTCDAIYPILEEKFGEQIAIYRSNDTLIEIAPKSVSKLSAIKLLLTDAETLEDIVAFGDNYNDLEMLKNVGCGVAVGNARDEVKEIANYTTLDNTDHGVAVFINDHIL